MTRAVFQVKPPHQGHGRQSPYTSIEKEREQPRHQQAFSQVPQTLREADKAVFTAAVPASKAKSQAPPP